MTHWPERKYNEKAPLSCVGSRFLPAGMAYSEAPAANEDNQWHKNDILIYDHETYAQPCRFPKTLNDAWAAPGDYSGLQIGLVENLVPAISMREQMS